MSWLRRHSLTLAAGLAAALPVIAATVRGITIDWMPLGDRAVIAVRSLDVLSTHPPLLGQYSAASQVLGQPVHSPGPLLYWLLALPVRLGPLVPAIAIGLVNTAVVIAAVALARRRGGVALMLATGAGIALVLASLEPSLPYDIWNPSAGLLAFTLLLFLAWSLACGEWRLLPPTVLVASFATQCHLGYALPALALLVVAGAFLLASRPRIPRRWWLATAAVLVVCWAAPLAESVVHRPGNFEQIARTALRHKPTFGAKGGVYAVVRAVGVAPWWLRSPRATFDRVGDVSSSPGAGAWVSAVLMVLGLAGLSLMALVRRRLDLAAGGALALAMLLPLALATASTPTRGLLFGTISYGLWWAHPAGMFLWLMTGFLAARLLLPAVPRPAWAGKRSLQAAGVAALALVGLVVALSAGPDRLEGAYPLGHDLRDRIHAQAPPGRTLLVAGSSTPLGFELEGAAVQALRENGPRPVTTLPGIGTPYNPAKRPHRGELRVTDGRPPRGGRVIARYRVSGVPGDAPPKETRNRRLTVTLTP
jgi:hypothetical protein